MSEIEVGVVGLGNMGSGVAGCFIRAGARLGVWDASDSALDPYRGRDDVHVMTPGDMAEVGATMFFVVPATPEIEACFDADGGVLGRAAPNLVVYDLTTSFPADTRRLAARARERGIDYLDAAMSGGATGAEAGTLTLMIGGERGAFERTSAHLMVIADDLFHLGPVGAGHTMKLIHNMACHSIFLATCEAGRMAERAGIALGDMIDVFNVSNATSFASQQRFPRHILSGAWDGRSRVYNLHKDLSMAVALAGELGARVPHGRATLETLQAAIARGMAESDFTLIYRDFDDVLAASDLS
jgi:3-hydroxyisobutyrate dehydrogenase